MSKYVDKMNLPQYRFYNHMVGEGEERKELVSDLLTAEMILERGSKKERSQALITLATKKKRLADFIYSQEEDRKRCLKDLTGRDMKQFRKRLDHYLDMPHPSCRSREADIFNTIGRRENIIPNMTVFPSFC